MQDFTIVVIGETGNGKSQLCNFLAGDIENTLYPVSSNADSHTNDTTGHIITNALDTNHSIRIYDTPGLNDSENRDIEHITSMTDTLKEYVSDVKAFCLVFNSEQPKFTKNMKLMCTLFADVFGRKYLENLCLVFTRWYWDDRSERRRIQTNTSQTSIREQFNRVVKERLDIYHEIPCYFIDTLPDSEEIDEIEKSKEEMVRMIMWATHNEGYSCRKINYSVETIVETIEDDNWEVLIEYELTTAHDGIILSKLFKREMSRQLLRQKMYCANGCEKSSLVNIPFPDRWYCGRTETRFCIGGCGKTSEVNCVTNKYYCNSNRNIQCAEGCNNYKTVRCDEYQSWVGRYFCGPVSKECHKGCGQRGDVNCRTQSYSCLDPYCTEIELSTISLNNYIIGYGNWSIRKNCIFNEDDRRDIPMEVLVSDGIKWSNFIISAKFCINKNGSNGTYCEGQAHPGFIFNAKNTNYYDSVYFRPHYKAKGIQYAKKEMNTLNYIKTEYCDVPYSWFLASLEINNGQVTVRIEHEIICVLEAYHIPGRMIGILQATSHGYTKDIKCIRL